MAALLGVGALVAVAMVGCATQGSVPGAEPSVSDSAPSASSTAPSAPPESPSPPASPEPSTAPFDGVRADGIGHVELGGSFASAAVELGVAPGDQCPWVLVKRGDWATWVIADRASSTATAPITLVSIDSLGFPDTAPAAAPRTAEGIGLGSTIDEVRTTYPSATTVPAPNMDIGLRYTQGQGSIVFEGQNGVVEAIKVMAANADNPSEYCG